MRTYIVLAFFIMIGLQGKSFASYPDIEFRYAHIFDSLCWGQKVPEKAGQWVTELYASLGDFKKEWDLNGNELLKATTTLFKKDFKRKEMTASVFLCQHYPSIGTPLMVKIGWFLKSPMMGRKPLKKHLFTSNVFHELLHTYLEDHFFTALMGSKLAQKYASQGESRTTITHLHLMSVMKEVYLKLGKSSELEEVINFENLFAPDYKKAWEIVNKDGHKPFLRELKASLVK